MSVIEKRMGNLSASAILAEIQAVASPAADKVPERWKTTHVWSKLWNKSYSHSVRLVSTATRAGLMERKEFRVMTDAGVVKPTPHYACVEKSK